MKPLFVLLVLLFIQGCSNNNISETVGETPMVPPTGDNRITSRYCNENNPKLYKVPIVEAKGTIHTGDFAELYECLPSPGPQIVETDYRVLYSIGLKNVKVGQKILIIADGEVTNDDELTHMVGSFIVASTASPTSTKGVSIAKALATNVSREIHHLIIQRQSLHTFTQNYDVIYINFVIYAAQSSQSSGGLTIEQNYGNMIVHFLK